MTGPSTPGQEGPSYAPPPLPEGWIAQWDGVSKKYYFVQLSTGASQWDTPTQAAPTGPTPNATPQGTEHPYGTPGQNPNVITNADGSQSIKHADGTTEPYSADRSLTSMAMGALTGGGKKPGHQQGGAGGLGGLASSFLGGGSKPSGGHSNAGPAGMIGALAGSLLGGGKKPDHSQQHGQQQHGAAGLMGNIGGMFGGGAHGGSHGGQQGGNNFGYSQNNNQQGGYQGSAPPTSYQPSGSAQTSYAPPHSGPPAQQSYHSSPAPHSGPPAQQSYHSSPPPNQQYGQNPPYGAPPAQGYGQNPPYGGPPHQDAYGGGHPPQNQQYPPPQGQHYPPPPGQYPQQGGNLPQPQHGHFQGMHNAEHSGGLYGNSPAGGQQGNYPPPQQGYGGGPRY